MPKYKSLISQLVHEDASDLYALGMLTEAEMQEFNLSCLAQNQQLSPNEIRQIRESTRLEQQYFANHLNVSKRTVQNWEKGVTKPSSTALKLLHTVKNKGIEALG